MDEPQSDEAAQHAEEEGPPVRLPPARRLFEACRHHHRLPGEAVPQSPGPGVSGDGAKLQHHPTDGRWC